MINRLALPLLAATLSTLVCAASDTSGFRVHLTLQPPAEKCISGTLSQQTGALVQVVCGSGNFVSIDPVPGRPFTGTHGAAFRFTFSGTAFAHAMARIANSSIDPYTGVGTVTSLRVVGEAATEHLDVLITF